MAHPINMTTKLQLGSLHPYKRYVLINEILFTQIFDIFQFAYVHRKHSQIPHGSELFDVL